MSSSWRRGDIAIAVRVAILLALISAWVLPGKDPEPGPMYPDVTIASDELRVTPSTYRGRPGQRIGVLVEYLSSNQTVESLLFANGRPVRRGALPSSGKISFDVDIPKAGPLTLGAEIRDRATGALLATQQVASVVNVVSTASVLVVANSPSVFAQSLKSGGWRVSEIRSSDLSTQSWLLRDHSMLVLDDIAATELSPTAMDAIQNAVRREAMGMLVLGGPNSFGLGGYRESRLEELLPVVSEPPADERAASVMFLIDVSGSMGRPDSKGDRLEIAKQAVLGSASALRQSDHVGLMSFHVETTENLPLGARASHSQAIREAWPLSASGGTRLAAAIQLALDKLEQDSNEFDLLVVLTDGRLAENDPAVLAAAMQSSTAQVIALVIDADSGQNTLSHLVEASNGRAIAIDDMLRLPALMREEVEQSRPAFIEGPAEVLVAVPSMWLPDLSLPAVDGYMLTSPRQSAEVHLVSERGDAIIASRNAGAGKVIAITSGLSGWITDWLVSDDWPTLAGNLARRLAMRDTRRLDLSVDLDHASLTVDLEEHQDADAVGATLTSPSGVTTALEFDLSAPRQLIATMELADPGRYLLNLDDGSAATRHEFVYSEAPPDLGSIAAPPGPVQAHELAWVLAMALFGFVTLLWWERFGPGSAD